MNAAGTYVGINNQTSPQYNLDVSGSARLGVATIANAASIYLVHTNCFASYGTSFALYQGAGGDTVLNAANNQPLEFKIQ